MFGTSRELNVGPVAIVSLIAFEALEAAGFRSCDLSECKAAPPLADPMCNQCIVDQTAWNQASIVLAFLSGLLQVVCGLLHLGVLATFLAQPVITGFNFASVRVDCDVFDRIESRYPLMLLTQAILIAGSQLKSVFGVKVESQSTIFETIYYCFKAAFFDGAMKWAALGTWIVATLILFSTTVVVSSTTIMFSFYAIAQLRKN
jgi:MFS superfamily sulfate permease-like transporter